MNKAIVLIVVAMFLSVGLVAAEGWPICIDMKAPDAPTDVSLSDEILTWNEADDFPDCSGIDYYIVYVDDTQLGVTTSTSYDVGSISGTLKVVAVDLAGNIGLPATTSSSNGGGGGNGGGSGGSGGGLGGSGGSLGGGSGGITINDSNLAPEFQSLSQDTTEKSSKCTPEWKCGAWAACEDGLTTRTCIDKEECGTDINKPPTTKSCDNDENTDEKGNLITGAVLGGGVFSLWGLIALIVIIAGLFGIFAYLRRKK